ncbi:MAG: EutN/CcmL family microcompartment protein [Acidobacteriota bacterium]|jgi:ethanolamine utilization protein EutN
MELARIEGSVVSTVKVDRLRGHKLMLVGLLKPDMSPSGTFLVAVDTVGAGVGEVVLVVRGSSARQTDKTATVPTDTTIVGIVDGVVFEGKMVYEKNAVGESASVSGAD